MACQDRHHFEGLCTHTCLDKMGCPADKKHLKKSSQAAMSEVYIVQAKCFAVPTGVLQKLLSIQALDAHDIEGIYPLYRHVLQQLRFQTDSPNVVHSLSPFEGISSESELSALQPQEAHVRSLLRKTWSEQISMIRDYLLATTAKDCSLMITMQALPAALPDHMDSQCHCSQFGEFQEGFDVVAVPKIAVQIKYTVAVVDLDVKPHAKILSHHCLDQKIMKQQAIL